MRHIFNRMGRAGVSVTLSREKFALRFIFSFEDMACPPRSPDLSAPDYILWGYLKSVCVKVNKELLKSLKTYILYKICWNSCRNIMQCHSKLYWLCSVMHTFPRNLHFTIQIPQTKLQTVQNVYVHMPV